MGTPSLPVSLSPFSLSLLVTFDIQLFTRGEIVLTALRQVIPQAGSVSALIALIALHALERFDVALAIRELSVQSPRFAQLFFH